jgi:excisionase family DNA binding protein
MGRRVTPINPEQRYLSPRQVGRVMGVSEYLIYKGVNAGEIPCRRLGERILIPREWAEGTPEAVGQ